MGTHSLPIGMQNGSATSVAHKTNILPPYDLASVLLGIYPEVKSTAVHPYLCFHFPRPSYPPSTTGLKQKILFPTYCQKVSISLILHHQCLGRSPHSVPLHGHFTTSYCHKKREHSTVRYFEKEKNHSHILSLQDIVISVLLLVLVNVLQCLTDKLNSITGIHVQEEYSIYRVPYYLRLQASSGDIGHVCPPWIRGDYVCPHKNLHVGV